MKKDLSKMSLEELWQLFPIFLTEPQAYWKEWYAEEESFLKKLLTQRERISHIGSTAVATIWAKPIIDILLEIPEEKDLLLYKNLLVENGYICMSQTENRLSFNKGYTEEGFAERVFHLHIRRFGDNDELYFRDYLIQHFDVAKEYEKMKLQLWKKYKYDRNRYTEAKTEFVRKWTQEARFLYKNQYDCVKEINLTRQFI